MLPYPETPSGEDLQHPADYFRQQAHRHALRGGRSSADICYQAADLRRQLLEPPPARRQLETSAERLSKHPGQRRQRTAYHPKRTHDGHGHPFTRETSP